MSQIYHGDYFDYSIRKFPLTGDCIVDATIDGRTFSGTYPRILSPAEAEREIIKSAASLFDRSVTLDVIMNEINPDLENDFEPTDNQGYSMEGTCFFRGRSYYVSVYALDGEADWKTSIAKEIYDQIHGILLAYTCGRCSEEWLWFPNVTKESLPILEKALEGDTPCYENIVNAYCIQKDTENQDEYNKWKDALRTRTQTFARKGFIFKDDNIKGLCPRGYIVMVKQPYYD